jgi:hypothetical protein
MTNYLKALAPLIVLSALALGSCSVLKLDVASAVGSWSGSWHNTTYTTTGTATMTITQDTTSKTVTMVLTLNGPVFGGGPPGPQTITGSYTDTAVSVSTTTPLFNGITMSVNNMGSVSGTAHPASFDSVTFSGSLTSASMSLNYTIYQPAGVQYAVGTLAMTKP